MYGFLRTVSGMFGFSNMMFTAIYHGILHILQQYSVHVTTVFCIYCNSILHILLQYSACITTAFCSYVCSIMHFKRKHFVKPP